MEDSLKSGINFEHLRVKKFDENGLYEQKTLVKTHFLFFQPHDVKLVNEDSGQGLIDGGNQYSYDLAPISSSKGVMHWAKKTLKQYLGPFKFLADWITYLILALILIKVYDVLLKIKNRMLRNDG